MGDIIDLYEIEKRKITDKHTHNGKLSRKGIRELFEHASKYGKVKEEYFPSDYGTREYYERD